MGDDPSDYDVKLLAEWFLEQLEAIPEGTTALTLDNATWVEAGLGYLVARAPAKYGVYAANVQSGRYGGVNPGITKLWANIVNYLQVRKGVRCRCGPRWRTGGTSITTLMHRPTSIVLRLARCGVRQS